MPVTSCSLKKADLRQRAELMISLPDFLFLSKIFLPIYILEIKSIVKFYRTEFSSTLPFEAICNQLFNLSTKFRKMIVKRSLGVKNTEEYIN